MRVCVAQSSWAIGFVLMLAIVTPVAALEGERSPPRLMLAGAYAAGPGARAVRHGCVFPLLKFLGRKSHWNALRRGHDDWGYLQVRSYQANRITFTLEVAFKRNTTDNSYWRGSAPDLLPQVGMPSLSVPQPYGNRRGGRPALQC